MALPYLTSDVPGVPGTMRNSPDDFIVGEIPSYAPSGVGTHLYVRFEKRGLTTPESVKRIANALGVDPRNAGFAGLKDRDAVTTQWASFEGATVDAAVALSLDGLRVLEASLHGNKLRTGHLRGNRFRLVLRDVDDARRSDVERVLERISRDGLPNYYGEQRFGRDGDNVAKARAWIVDGGRAPRDHFQRKLLASALQSEVFNRVVAGRVEANELGRVFEGELVRKEDTGGLFVATDVDEVNARSLAWAVSPTGPMFGPEMRWPESVAKEREEAILAEAGLSAVHLERLGRSAPGTRRVVRIRPADLSWEWNPGSVVLSFELPAGSYATALVREICKQDGIRGDRS